MRRYHVHVSLYAMRLFDVYIATSEQNFQISGIKHGDDWMRRELTIADDLRCIIVKFWNDAITKLDHVQLGSFVTVSNVVTALFRGFVSLNNTLQTTVQEVSWYKSNCSIPVCNFLYVIYMTILDLHMHY
jgi:hypothetical protein